MASINGVLPSLILALWLFMLGWASSILSPSTLLRAQEKWRTVVPSGRPTLTSRPSWLNRSFKMSLYPCSTKRREGLENPSPTPKISRDFPRPWVLHPETRGISRGRSPREIPRVEGCKTHGQGKSRGRRGWIFQSLPNLGGARTFSHHYQGRPSLVFIVI